MVAPLRDSNLIRRPLLLGGAQNLALYQSSANQLVPSLYMGFSTGMLNDYRAAAEERNTRAKVIDFKGAGRV